MTQFAADNRERIGGQHLVLAGCVLVPLTVVQTLHPRGLAVIPHWPLLVTLLAVFPGAVGGFGQLLLPPLIGATEMATPTISLAALLLLVPAIGATAIALMPHATSAHMAQACIIAASLLAGLSCLLLALNHVTTVINMRGRGVSFHRLPLFVWAQLIAAGMMLLFLAMLAGGATVHLWAMIVALPVLPAAWHAMHPLAYVMMLPCLGIVAEAVRPSIAIDRSIRLYVAYALLALGLLGFATWARAVLTASAGAWPDWLAVIFSALIVTALLPMIARCHRVGAAQLWAFGALFVFATGIAADAALLGTHASQAFSHVCFVLSIGCLFSGFAGTYAWLGRRLRRRLPERWGIAHFITAFVGLNLALLPAHVLPLVPRLAGIIDADTGAILIAVGTLLFFLSLGLFAVVLVRSAAASDWSAADAWAPWIPPRAKTP